MRSVGVQKEARSWWDGPGDASWRSGRSTVATVVAVTLTAVALTLGSLDASAQTVPRQLLIRVDAATTESLRATGGNAVAGLRASLPIATIDPVVNSGPARQTLLGRYFRLTLATDVDLDDALRRLRLLPFIEHAQPNYRYQPDLVPNDPLFASQYAHAITSAPCGWDFETGMSVTIAIIGTGVEWSHPDLASRIWSNAVEVAGTPGADDDGNGFIDDVRGWSFEDASNDPGPNPVTPNPHETQVAGVAAADTDNNLGVAGVCWDCRIMPIRVAYNSDDVAQSIDYAARNGAQVINMSFGSYDPMRYGPDSIVIDAVDAAWALGVVLVATAGNDSTNQMRYPAALDNVIAVAATDAGDQRAAFSNFGSWVSVAAPGAAVQSTDLGGGYRSVNGTSFAAPYVAGAAALLWSTGRFATNAEVRRRVEYAVDLLSTDQFIGSGRVNLCSALDPTYTLDPFAIIKSPTAGQVVSTTFDVVGTALGDSFMLEYRAVGAATWTFLASGAETVDDVLGPWDAASLAEGCYELRLSVTCNPAPGRCRNSPTPLTVEHTISVYRASPSQVGWPVAAASDIVNSASWADLDQDGDFEVVFGDNSGSISAYHHDGTPLTGWPRTAAAYPFGGPSIGDIDGDGDPEIFTGSYASFLVYAWHHDGTPVAGWPVSFPADARMRGAVVLADLNSDFKLDVVIARIGGQLWALNGDGTPLSGWPVAVENNMQTTPVVGDIDGDLDPEVIAHSWNNLYAFHHDGTPVTGFPIAFNGGHTSPVLNNFDADPALEIAVAGTTCVRVYEGNGTLSSELCAPMVEFSYSTLATGDLDRDGRPELYIGGDLGAVYRFEPGDPPIVGWPVQTGANVAGGMALFDIDGDGDQDVVGGSEDGRLYAWDADGTFLYTCPIGLGGLIFATPTVADLDCDGSAELILGVAAGGASVMHVRDLGVAFDPTLTDWSMFQGGPRHTGYAPDFDLATAVAGCSICDLPAIAAISDLTAVKRPASLDVLFAWTADAGARDGYNVSWVEDKTLVPACQNCPGAQPVPSCAPTGVLQPDRCTHAGALDPSLSPLFLYEARGVCNGTEAPQ